jgi:molybdopterin biosynthesis enzyme MoaB
MALLQHDLEARRVVGGDVVRWAMLSSSSRRSLQASRKEGNRVREGLVEAPNDVVDECVIGDDRDQVTQGTSAMDLN